MKSKVDSFILVFLSLKNTGYQNVVSKIIFPNKGKRFSMKTSKCLCMLLLLVIVGESSQKTCSEAHDLIECFRNRTGFIECDYNRKTRKYELTAEVLCNAGTECSCMIGDDCPAEKMCQKITKRLDFVDTGMLTWSGSKSFEEDGGYEDDNWVTTGDIRGFAYKAPNGRMYREVMNTFNWRGHWEYFLYIPVEADTKTFRKIHKALDGKCTETLVSSPMRLVPKSLIDGFMLKEDEKGQHWQWRHDIGVEWKKWDFYVKQFRGKLIPLYFKYSEMFDGMGLGSWGNEKVKFTYQPQVIEAKMSMKENKLLQNCGMS